MNKRAKMRAMSNNHLLHYRRSSARRISTKIRFHGGLLGSLLQFFLFLLLSLRVFVDLLVSLQRFLVCKSRPAFFTRILFFLVRLAHIFSSDKNLLQDLSYNGFFHNSRWDCAQMGMCLEHLAYSV